MKGLTMKNKFKLACLGGLMIVSTAGVASARSMQANTGHNISGWANEGCMRTNWQNGGVQNSCGSAQLWEVTLPVDSTGGKAVTVSGYFSSASQCIAIAFDKYGTGVSQSSWWPFTGLLSYQSKALTASPVVPSAGYLQVQCWVSPNEIMHSVSWTP